MDKLTFGIIGAGMIGRAHARALAELETVGVEHLAATRASGQRPA